MLDLSGRLMGTGGDDRSHMRRDAPRGAQGIANAPELRFAGRVAVRLRSPNGFRRFPSMVVNIAQLVGAAGLLLAATGLFIAWRQLDKARKATRGQMLLAIDEALADTTTYATRRDTRSGILQAEIGRTKTPRRSAAACTSTWAFLSGSSTSLRTAP